MSPKNRYKVKNLVSNKPNIAKFRDELLEGSSGILIDEKTLRIANNGNNVEGHDHVMTHYEFNGQPLPDRVFFPRGEPTVLPIQEQLLYELLFLYKTWLATTSGMIFQVPIPNNGANQPVIDSETTTTLISFLSGPPNGYLSFGLDVTQLVNFCVDTPNALPPVPIDSTLQGAFSVSIQSVINTSLDVLNQSLIDQLTLDLQNNQSLLPSSSNFNSTQLKIMVKKDDRQQNIVSSVFPISLILNESGNFVITTVKGSAASKIVAATYDGRIWGYNPLVDPENMVEVINNDVPRSLYVGLTIAGNNLYVADFANNRIDVYNFDFKLLREIEFIDPSLPSDYAPFDIVNIDNLLYILYAKIDLSTQHDYIVGPGNGFINIFKPDGTFVRRFVSQGQLNAPWGLVVAPKHFKPFNGKFLVSNRGDGKINVYNKDGKHIAKLKDKRGHTIVINGLWGLASHIRSVYFASDLGHPIDGLVGKISPR